MLNVSDATDTANSSATPSDSSSAKPEPAASPRRPPDAPPGAAEPPEAAADPLVHFALRSDGAILLNAADLKGFDLSGREVFVGVVLTPTETRATVVRLANAAAEVAAKLVGSLRRSLSRLTS